MKNSTSSKEDKFKSIIARAKESRGAKDRVACLEYIKMATTRTPLISKETHDILFSEMGFPIEQKEHL